MSDNKVFIIFIVTAFLALLIGSLTTGYYSHQEKMKKLEIESNNKLDNKDRWLKCVRESDYSDCDLAICDSLYNWK